MHPRAPSFRERFLGQNDSGQRRYNGDKRVMDVAPRRPQSDPVLLDGRLACAKKGLILADWETFNLALKAEELSTLFLGGFWREL